VGVEGRNEACRADDFDLRTRDSRWVHAALLGT
jgi:hypothetical protein